MLGWCPRPSLQHRTSGRSCISHNHEIVHFSSAFEDEKPVLQPPHQIVIGFDLGSGSSKSLLTQACESPRSVLEPHHLHRPQPGSPRSPLSALGSLLADCTCVRSTIKAEEITSEVHTYHPVLKSEHVVCGADRVRAYDVSDPVARPNHGRVRASKNQPWEGRSCVREGFVNRHSSAIFSSDDDDDDFDDDSDVEMSKSIFCAASPVSDGFTSGDQPEDFLSKCFRCSRRLGQGKDIYMYRGDQAFCSQECRYKQIVADERKDKSSAVAPPFFRVTGGHHTSVARVAQAALW